MIENTQTLIHALLNRYLSPEMIVCDMTCGNGWDSQYILQKIDGGFLYAFDIQERACRNTKTRLSGFQNFQVIQDSHQNVQKYCSKCDLAIYNLGYLPHGDKNITTNYHEVIHSLQELMAMHTRYIFLTVYVGHTAGKEEKVFVEKFLRQVDQQEYNIIKYEFINQKNEAPYVISLEYRK